MGSCILECLSIEGGYVYVPPSTGIVSGIADKLLFFIMHPQPETVIS